MANSDRVCPAPIAILSGGPGGAVQVDGTTMYWSQGQMLKIADISEPSAPVVLGQVSLPRMAKEIRVRDGTLYAACGDAGVLILDVIHADQPSIIGHYHAMDHSAVDVEIIGCHLFVVDEWHQVLILDVSDPQVPFRAGALTIACPYPERITIQGSTLYVVAYHGVYCFDLANPVTPRLTRVIDQYCADVAVSGSWMFLLAEHTIIPFPEGEPLLLPYSYADVDFASRLTVKGQRGAVMTEMGTIFLLDLSAPTVPRVMGRFRLDLQDDWHESTGGLVLADGLLLAAHSATGTGIWQIEPEGRFDFQTGWLADLTDFTVWDSWGVGVRNGIWEDNQLIITDLSAPSPIEAGRLVLPGRGASRLKLCGTLAFVIMEKGGLSVVDIADPRKPALLSSYSFSETTADIQLYGNYAYITTKLSVVKGRGLHVLDVSNPEEPQEIHYVPGDHLNLIIDSGRLYSYCNCKVTAFDLSLPAFPQEIMNIPLGSGYDCQALAIKDFIAAASWSSHNEWGVGLWDIQDLSSPRLLSHVPVSLSIKDVWMDGAHLFVGEYLSAECDPVSCPPAGYLSAWDITDPLRPSIAAYADTGSDIRRLGGDGDRLSVLHWGKVSLYNRASLHPMPQRWSEVGPEATDLWSLQHPWAYSGESGGVFKVINMSDPIHPRTVSRLNLSSQSNARITSIEPSRDHAFVVVAELGLYYIYYVGLADPLHPLVLGVQPMHNVAGISSRSPYLFATTSSGSLQVIDWGDPDAPVIVAQVQMEWESIVPVAEGDVLALRGQKSIVFCDISDPRHPHVGGSLLFPEGTIDIAWANTIAFIGTNKGLWSANIEDSNHPFIIGSLFLRTKAFAVMDTKLISVRPSSTWNLYHIADGGGVDVIEAAEPSAMRHVGFYPAHEGVDVLIGPDYIFLTSDRSNAWIFDATSCEEASGLPPIPRFSWNPSKIILGEPIEFNAWNEGNAALEWEWEFGDGSGSEEVNPIHRFYRSGLFRISLKARNAMGEGTIVLWIEVRETGAWPNASHADGALYVLPVAARASGANGTDWATDLILHNPTANGARILLYRLISPYDCSRTSPQEWYLEGQRTERYADYGGRWDYGRPWLGALLMASDTMINAWARIYNKINSGGSYGERIALVPMEEALAAGETAFMTGLECRGGERINVGVANLSSDLIEVRITLKYADGREHGAMMLKVPPYSHGQREAYKHCVLAWAGSGLFAEVTSETPGARYFAYASVVDPYTGDPSYIPAIR